jgi:hypothetical protein
LEESGCVKESDDEVEEEDNEWVKQGLRPSKTALNGHKSPHKL